MGRFRIEDFPEKVQAEIRAQLGEYAKPIERSTHQVPPLMPARERSSREPNKTEADYKATHLRGLDARYEAITFRMSNGHRYTPDWVVFDGGRPTGCHECKGGYAMHSQQRARLAFDQCAKEFGGLRWVWAVKKGGKWVIDG